MLQANAPSPGRSTARMGQWWAVLRPQRLSVLRMEEAYAAPTLTPPKGSNSLQDEFQAATHSTKVLNGQKEPTGLKSFMSHGNHWPMGIHKGSQAAQHTQEHLCSHDASCVVLWLLLLLGAPPPSGSLAACQTTDHHRTACFLPLGVTYSSIPSNFLVTYAD